MSTDAPLPVGIPPLWSWAPDATYLYFMTSGDYIKVGISNNPERRRRELLDGLNRTILPPDWDGQIKLISHRLGGKEAEAALHARFAPARVAGEWFHATPELREEATLTLLAQARTELELHNLTITEWTPRGQVAPVHDLDDLEAVIAHSKTILTRPEWAVSEQRLRELSQARAA